MLDFLFKKEAGNACENLNSFYSKLREMHSFESITEERKEYLKSTMTRFGYLPYPQIKALEELTDAEVLFLNQNGKLTVFLKMEVSASQKLVCLPEIM